VFKCIIYVIVIKIFGIASITKQNVGALQNELVDVDCRLEEECFELLYESR
jgi:hypothetical protein